MIVQNIASYIIAFLIIAAVEILIVFIMYLYYMTNHLKYYMIAYKRYGVPKIEIYLAESKEEASNIFVCTQESFTTHSVSMGVKQLPPFYEEFVQEGRYGKVR